MDTKGNLYILNNDGSTREVIPAPSNDSVVADLRGSILAAADAEAEMAQARAELAALKEANRWIPINGRFCLVLRITNSNFTHWRYLPEPPEVSE